MPDQGEIRAAGAVLWRPAPGGLPGVRVAVVHRPRYDDWSLPKGKSLPGEHVAVTAVREAAEETGVDVALGRRLPSARYLADGVAKHVDYWVARPHAGSTGSRFIPGAEVDEVAWLPVDEARARLTYPRDVAELEAFTAGPAETTPVILARHAIARSKQAWRADGHSDDLPRPLTARGRAQAQALATLLDCFAPTRVVSSRAERCLATVRPYAGVREVAVEGEPAFTVGPSRSRPADGTGARGRIAELITAGRPTVICAHRENLPSLLGWACEVLGAPVPEGPPLRKGAFWVLQVSGSELASAEQHHPGMVAGHP